MNDSFQPGQLDRPTFFPSLQSWRVQSRVIGALVLREVQTRFGRSNIGYLWAFAEPLTLLALFYALFHYLGRFGSIEYNPIAFLATGIITFTSIRTMAASLSGAVSANKGLLVYPQVTPLDAIAARTILQSATFLVILFVILGTAWLFDVAPRPHDFLGTLIALGMFILLGLSIGLLQHGILSILPMTSHILSPSWRVLFFTSCVFYTMNDLPYSVQEIIYYNPLAHGIEMLRHAYFVGYESPVKNYHYMLVCSGICLFMGLLIERLYRYKGNEQ